MLDPNDQFLLQSIGPVMFWPHEPTRWKDAHATWGSELIHLAGTLDPAALEPLLKAAIAAIAAERGVTPESLVTPEIQAAMRAASATHAPSFIQRIAVERMFNPAGGHLAVARAPGSDVLTSEMKHAAEIEGNASGAALIIIAQLAIFHPHLSASLNRAAHIMIKCKEKNPEIKWPAERGFKDAWARYRAISPLWAAQHVVLRTLATEAFVRGTPFTDTEALFQQQLSSNRRRFIAWALWFRDFARSHTPPGAAGALIPAEALLRMDTPVPLEMPPLGPLDADALADALNYRAPMPMQ